MRSKLLALALAVAVTMPLAVGSVTAAGAGSDADVEFSESNAPDAEVDVDGYEFTVSDENDAFGTGALESVPRLVMSDADAAERVRDVFDEDETLSAAVHGSLVEGEDGAHVRITSAAADEDAADPRVVEVRVDVATEAVDVVGVDAERTPADERIAAEETTSVHIDGDYSTAESGEVLHVSAVEGADGAYDARLTADESVTIRVETTGSDPFDIEVTNGTVA